MNAGAFICLEFFPVITGGRNTPCAWCGCSRSKAASPRRAESAKLEPIRFVTRELTRPDGSTLSVKVPVYPPFQLADAKQKGQEKKAS